MRHFAQLATETGQIFKHVSNIAINSFYFFMILSFFLTVI